MFKLCKGDSEESASYTSAGSLYKKLNTLWWVLGMAVLFRIFTDPWTFLRTWDDGTYTLLMPYIFFAVFLFALQMYLAGNTCKALAVVGIGLTGIFLVFDGALDMLFFILYVSIGLGFIGVMTFYRMYSALYFIVIHIVLTIASLVGYLFLMSAMSNESGVGHPDALSMMLFVYPTLMITAYITSFIDGIGIYLLSLTRVGYRYKYYFAIGGAISALVGFYIIQFIRVEYYLEFFPDSLSSFFILTLSVAMLASCVVIILVSRYFDFLQTDINNNIIQPSLLAVIVVMVLLSAPVILDIVPDIQLQFGYTMLYSK